MNKIGLPAEPESDHSSSATPYDDLQLAMAMSLSIAAEMRRREEEELQRVLSLSLVDQ